MTNIYIVIRYESAFDRIYEVQAIESVIGRDEKCDIWLADRVVSREHALLLRTAEGCQIRDLGSRNGTRLNGHPIVSNEVLIDGSELQIGPFSLQVCFTVGAAVGRTVDVSDSTRSFNPADRGQKATGPQLTTAQRRVYDLLIQGLIEKEVAHRLGISIHTVHDHSKAIYKALSVSTRGEMIARGTRGDRQTQTGD